MIKYPGANKVIENIEEKENADIYAQAKET